VSFALLLLFALLSWTSQSAQSNDSQKADPPAGQETPKPRPIRVRQGGNVAKARLRHKVQPQYPAEAIRNRTQGTVRLHVILSTEGKVQQLDLMSGDPGLAKSAIEAVRQWEYAPVFLNGQPIEVETTVDVIFSLSQ
jgi:protein TonB